MTDPFNPAPPVGPPHDGELLGPIGDYLGFALRSLGRHKLLATSAFVLVAALGVGVARVVPLKYQVLATLLVQKNPLVAALSNPGMSRDWDAPTLAARETVIRRQNLVALCEQTEFVKRYRASRAPAIRARDWLVEKLTGKPKTDAQVLDDLVNALEQKLWVTVGQEGTVTIGFTWSDPELAYAIVQAAVQNYLEARNTAEIGAMGEAIAILQGHDARVQKDIATAIEQLEDKERALRIQQAPRRTPVVRASALPDEELVRLRGVLAARRRALADLEDYRQRRQTELQTQLDQLLAVYAPEHPAVVSARQSLEAIATPSPQIADLRAEIAKLEQDVASRAKETSEPPQGPATLEMDLAQARLTEAQDPRLEYEREQLEMLLRRHAALVDRIDSTRIALNTAQVAFEQRYSIISPARRPKGPLKPYRLMLSAAGVVGGALFALFVTVVRDLSRGRILERWQVEQALDLPVLTELRR